MKHGLKVSAALAALGAACGVSAPASGFQITEYFIGQVRPVFENYCPENSSPANGGILAIADHTALWSLLGCTYGGDCRTTFALPDMRNRTPIGAGQSDFGETFALGQRGGDPRPFTANEVTPHSHGLVGSTQAPNVDNPTRALTPTAPANRNFYAVAINAQSAPLMDGRTISQSGAANNAHVYHPVLAINYCVHIDGVFPSRP